MSFLLDDVSRQRRTTHLKVLLSPPFLTQEPDDNLSIQILRSAFDPPRHLFQRRQARLPVCVTETCLEVLRDHLRRQRLGVLRCVLEFERVQRARRRRDSALCGFRRSSCCRRELLDWRGCSCRSCRAILRTTGCRSFLALDATLSVMLKLSCCRCVPAISRVVS